MLDGGEFSDGRGVGDSVPSDGGHVRSHALAQPLMPPRLCHSVPLRGQARQVSNGRLRTTKYLKKASLTRTCAIGGFFLSIPLFLIGIVLFTFLHFNETPAIVTSVVIGLGIVFCGGAVIHNVFVWQREKTVITKGSTAILNGTLKDGTKSRALSQSHIVLPHATLDLSNGFNGTIMAKSLELSTLV